MALGRSFPPNTVDELRTLAGSGVELGGHTRTHADLGRVADSGVLYDELVGGVRELEELVGRPVRYFAFPYGQYANFRRRPFGWQKTPAWRAFARLMAGSTSPATTRSTSNESPWTTT